MSYPSLIAETVTLVGHDDNSREAYYARPRRDAKFPGVVGVHHQPSLDEWITEVVRKFTHHAYAAISPHLYFRSVPGSPDDVGAKVRPRVE